jgi:hypothetical protein
VIILKVHVGHRIALKPESNPPVACHSDAVFAFPVTPKRMKLPARHGRHLREVVGKLQGGEDRLDFPNRVDRDAARIVIFVKASETFMTKLSDNRLCGITVRLSSRAARVRFGDVLPQFAFPNTQMMSAFRISTLV